MMWSRRIGGWMVAVLCLLTVTGCTKQLRTENNQLKEENIVLRESLESTRQALDDSMASQAQLNDKVSAIQQEMAQVKQQAATPPPAPMPAPRPVAPAPRANQPADSGFGGISGVGVQVGRNQVRVRVSGDVLFASGSASVRTSAQRPLGQIAKVLNTRYPNSVIRVEGHTDSDPIRKSKWGSNQALSLQRATSVQRYLITKGVSAQRLITVGLGATQPRASNKTAGGKAQNRRVEIIVMTGG